MSKPQLLIDTDPGVDDALAILMAAEYAEIAALTVTAGNTGLAHTVRNACRLADLLALDVPVYPGAAEPLLGAPDEDAVHVHGKDGFGDAGLPEPRHRPTHEHAALAINRMSRERPGELTLVALGPLTNLALAVKLDPELPKRIARLVVMGGAVRGQGNTGRLAAEFNIGFDPEAARIVFAAFPAFELVDWELTLRAALDETRVDRWLARGDQRAGFYTSISGLARDYNRRQGRPGVVAADALAMAVAVEPAVVREQARHHLGVELAGAASRGMTVVDWEGRSGRPANARIAMAVDQARFEQLVAGALGAADAPDCSGA